MNLRDRWLNQVFRGPDMEGGSGGSDDLHSDGGGGDVGGVGLHEGGDEGEAPKKGLSVRESLDRTVKELQGTDDKTQRGGKKPAQQTSQRAADQMREGTQPEGEPQQQQQQQQGLAAPASLSKEAKAAWANTPPEVQQAFVKREQDMEKGVTELKQRYEKIDAALAPHNDAIRQMNATPADAVDRLFLWFKAFAGDPVNAVPGVIKAMGYDWNKVINAINSKNGIQQPQQQGQPQQGAQQQQQQPAIPPALQQYVGNLQQEIAALKQQFGQVSGGFQAMQTDFQRQQQQKTEENLNIWSKDKPHFNDVRQTMAQIIQGGLVPLKDGQVDLDTVYERAIHFMPEVRAKVFAEQQQANQQVQEQARQAATTASQKQVQQARKASVSLPTGTPGQDNRAPGAVKKKPGQRTSVRESLMGAINELRE